ncbi:jg11810 [Pararge aegeria aegeria]|uniref:Jg11810 protein n=1 Tax=Pararge aegeria aegeria TaxID=348720 RepID=A0A8S4S4J5_9NEOP|nr:jg11810 [Pararge aegeria aegeria]
MGDKARGNEYKSVASVRENGRLPYAEVPRASNSKLCSQLGAKPAHLRHFTSDVNNFPEAFRTETKLPPPGAKSYFPSRSRRSCRQLVGAK